MKRTAWTRTANSGEVEVTAIRDSYFPMTPPIFRGAPDERMKELLPEGAIWSPVLGFLVHTAGKTILIDAGWGEGHGFLIRLLKEAGVSPQEIDTVLLTHMHFDHIGGLLTATGTPAFPNAVIRVSEPELQYWQKESGYNAELAAKVLAAYGDRLKSFRSNEVLEGGIRPLEAAGHTPGHTLYELGDFLFTGDLIHVAALQLPEPDITAFFEDMPAAVAARKKYYRYAAETGKTVCGAHLPFPGIGGVVCGSDGGFQLQLQELL